MNVAFFISYSRTDRKLIARLRQKLSAAGHRVWVDTYSIAPAGNWKEEIDAGIRESDAVVVLFSRSSIHSDYVNYEWAYALGAKVPVVPLRLHGVSMHPRLGAINFIDMSERNTKRWRQIVEALRRFERTFEISKNPMRARRPSAVESQLPQLMAKFELDIGGRPIRIAGSREYAMVISLRNVPSRTSRVRYEILDESFKDRKWVNSKPLTSFSDEMSSYGDVVITARGLLSRPGEEIGWSIEESLSHALRRGHPRAGKPIQKALEYIEAH